MKIVVTKPYPILIVKDGDRLRALSPSVKKPVSAEALGAVVHAYKNGNESIDRTKFCKAYGLLLSLFAVSDVLFIKTDNLTIEPDTDGLLDEAQINCEQEIFEERFAKYRIRINGKIDEGCDLGNEIEIYVCI